MAHPENQAASLQNSWSLSLGLWTIAQHLWVLQNEDLQRLHGPSLSFSHTLSLQDPTLAQFFQLQ